jgi:hypothetical protein
MMALGKRDESCDLRSDNGPLSLHPAIAFVPSTDATKRTHFCGVSGLRAFSRKGGLGGARAARSAWAADATVSRTAGPLAAAAPARPG